MKIILTRDGHEKSKVNTGLNFDDSAAVKFLAEIVNKKEKDKSLAS
jgi:hypothetical protein